MHPRTAIHIEKDRTLNLGEKDWVWVDTVELSRPGVKKVAQELADSKGCRVRTTRRDSTGFVRFYFPASADST